MVLGSQEIGLCSEQLGEMARLGDGHTRAIEPLPRSPSQPPMTSRNGGRVAQCTCPWHRTHVVFPYSSIFGNFRHMQNEEE